MIHPRLLIALTMAAIVSLTASTTSASTAAANSSSDPSLRVARRLLERALSCSGPLNGPREPVLLVHGTSVTADENWAWNYEKVLPDLGYDVCTVDLPHRALDDAQISTEYVVYAILSMSREAGRRVDVIGLSQGGLEPRWAIRWWPSVRATVDDYIGMASLNHGSVFADASCVQSCIPVLWQSRVEGSNFMAALNSGDETPGKVSYTSVYSITDEIIQPYTTVPLEGGTNIAVQDLCPGRYVGHVQSASDAAYYALVMDALEHPGPAVLSRIDPLICSEVVMPGVDPVVAVERTAYVYYTAGLVQSEYEKVDREPPLAPYAR